MPHLEPDRKDELRGEANRRGRLNIVGAFITGCWAGTILGLFLAQFL